MLMKLQLGPPDDVDLNGNEDDKGGVLENDLDNYGQAIAALFVLDPAALMLLSPP